MSTEKSTGQRPSEIIDLKRLEHETQKYLFIGLMLAFMIHPVVGTYFMFRKYEEPTRDMYTVRFALHTARLTKPFELKPSYAKQRMMYREELNLKYPVPDLKSKVDATIQYKDRHDVIEITTDHLAAFDDVSENRDKSSIRTVAPETVASPVSLKSEMLSIDDLDIGQFKAMVVQETSKHLIHGFVYLSSMWGTQLRVPDKLKGSVIKLVEAVNRYTNIDAKVSHHLMLDSNELITMPLVYITTDHAFQLTPTERVNLGSYLRAGGFAVIDNGAPGYEQSPAASSLKQMLRDALGTGAQFLPIPNEHQLYHCFFDFSNGPPQGAEMSMITTTTTGVQGETARNSMMAKPVHYLEGIWIDGRLAAVYSDKGYCCKWNDPSNNEPQLRMGVNLVVYALTQEGGIAQKVMSGFSCSE
ncbi:DUF4159 domain-containing protein [Candidatus Latescibacterota bacterium]